MILIRNVKEHWSVERTTADPHFLGDMLIAVRPLAPRVIEDQWPKFRTAATKLVHANLPRETAIVIRSVKALWSVEKTIAGQLFRGNTLIAARSTWVSVQST